MEKLNSKKLKKDYLNRNFSYAYVEKDVMENPVTIDILNKIKPSSIIQINHYKDVFCRKNQSFSTQKSSQQIIIARKTSPYLYPGSDMCDSFGHSNFYYCINAMNCVYDCEYCYLRGAYLSGNLVVFINLDDIFIEIEKMIKEKPIFLCNSYDTDLLAIESFTGFIRRWIEFARDKKNLTLEIRTKSAAFDNISNLAPSDNIILAWSLSPTGTALRHEYNTPSPKARIKAMKKAIDAGWNVRLCIDPIIYSSDWKEEYEELVKEIKSVIDKEQFYDYSLGVFRVPKNSLKIMRAVDKESVIAAFPYSINNKDGICTYSEHLQKEMIQFVTECLEK